MALAPLTVVPTATNPSNHLQEADSANYSVINSTQTVAISTYPNGVSNSFKVDVPEGEAIRSMSMELAPQALPRTDGHSFTTSSDFNQSGANSQGVDYNGSGLSVSAIDEYWSFDSSSSLPTGWSSTNSYYGTINTMSCGTNGSSSRSLVLRHGTVSVTSNVIDLSSLSQGILALWMTEGRSGCGEDPDSSEHLYVEYKRSSGSWGQITYYNAGLGYPGYTNRNDQFNLPNDAFHSNFQFRFRMPYGSGTCCDWWFVDDVRLTKPGGAGNWTSPAFGHGAQSPNFRSLPGSYGSISIDADAPADAVSWSVIDGSTGDLIDGFVDREERWADLGGIDWVRHTSIKLRVSIEAVGTGSQSKVNGIHIQGKLVESFDDDPSNWDLISSSWDGDSIVGTGIATSPEMVSRSPITMVTTALDVTGSGELQMSVDGEQFQPITSNGTIPIDGMAHSIQFRYDGTGNSFDLRTFDAHIHSAGLPRGAKIDIGLDGRSEWSLLNQSIGNWGCQDVFSTGNLSETHAFPGQKTMYLWIPRDSDGRLILEVMSNETSPVSDLMVDLNIGGTLVSSWNVGDPEGAVTLSVDEIDRPNLRGELATSTAIWSDGGVEYVQAELTLDASGGQATFGGLSIPHSPVAQLDYQADSSMVMALNDMVASVAPLNGVRSVSLPLGWEYPAAMQVKLTGLVTDISPTLVLESASNLTSTLTPSDHIYEFQHNVSFASGALSALRYDLVGVHHSVSQLVSFDQSGSVNSALSGDVGVVEVPSQFDIGQYNMTAGAEGVCCELHPNLQFKISSLWEDEDQVKLMVRATMADGLISLPWVHTFGVGPVQGVENDWEISSWSVTNEKGIVVPEESSYLKAGSNVQVSVDFGFEGMDDKWNPRDGTIEVGLLLDGTMQAQSTSIQDGQMDFMFTVPQVIGEVEISLEASPKAGGSEVTSISLNRTFEIDPVPPSVLSQTMQRHDNLEPSMTQTLGFEIADSPVLPTDVTLMLWRQWQDDFDQDGEMDADEFEGVEMQLPENLSATTGNYTFVFDDTYGIEGQRVAGYIVGSDPAGNTLAYGGDYTEQGLLFTYQLKVDEAPSIDKSQASWGGGERSWLHPATTYSLLIPFSESNGYADVSSVELSLATGLDDPVTMSWDSETSSCSSTSEWLLASGCEVVSQSDELDAFTSSLALQANFSLDWGFPVGGDVLSPSLEVVDRAGQGDWVSLPELGWRFSTDIEIPAYSLSLSAEEGGATAEHAWVAPSSEVTLSGTLQFAQTGDVPDTSLEVRVTLGGSGHTVDSDNGTWSATLDAPRSATEDLELTYSLHDLPLHARDVTDARSLAVTIDSAPPMPTELVSPSIESEIPIDTLAGVTIELKIKEEVRLDTDSLYLSWRVVEGTRVNSPTLYEGNTSLTLPAYNPSGDAIPVRAVVDLATGVPAALLNSDLTLHAWVIGQDMVGNQMVSDVTYNSPEAPFGSWLLQKRMPDMLITQQDLNYSSYAPLELGGMIEVTVTVHNLGNVYGVAEVYVEEVSSDMSITQVTTSAATIGVDPGKSSDLVIEWSPSQAGYQKVQVRFNGDVVAVGEEISIHEPVGDDIMSQLEQKGFTIELLGLLGLLLVMLLCVVLISSRVSRVDESDWEESLDSAEEVEQEAPSPHQGMTPEQFAAWQQWAAWQQYGQQQQSQYQGWESYQKKN